MSDVYVKYVRMTALEKKRGCNILQIVNLL